MLSHNLLTIVLCDSVHYLQKIFCSGGNLDCLPHNPLFGYKVSLIMNDIAARMRRLPLTSTCHVDGRAIGGGAEIALWTDFRSFTPSGQLMLVQAKMGVATAFSGVLIWKRGHIFIDIS